MSISKCSGKYVDKILIFPEKHLKSHFNGWMTLDLSGANTYNLSIPLNFKLT